MNSGEMIPGEDSFLIYVFSTAHLHAALHNHEDPDLGRKTVLPFCERLKRSHGDCFKGVLGCLALARTLQVLPCALDFRLDRHFAVRLAVSLG